MKALERAAGIGLVVLGVWFFLRHSLLGGILAAAFVLLVLWWAAR